MPRTSRGLWPSDRGFIGRKNRENEAYTAYWSQLYAGQNEKRHQENVALEEARRQRAHDLRMQASKDNPALAAEYANVDDINLASQRRTSPEPARTAPAGIREPSGYEIPQAWPYDLNAESEMLPSALPEGRDFDVRNYQMASPGEMAEPTRALGIDEKGLIDPTTPNQMPDPDVLRAAIAESGVQPSDALDDYDALTRLQDSYDSIRLVQRAQSEGLNLGTFGSFEELKSNYGMARQAQQIGRAREARRQRMGSILDLMSDLPAGATLSRDVPGMGRLSVRGTGDSPEQYERKMQDAVVKAAIYGKATADPAVREKFDRLENAGWLLDPDTLEWSYNRQLYEERSAKIQGEIAAKRERDLQTDRLTFLTETNETNIKTLGKVLQEGGTANYEIYQAYALSHGLDPMKDRAAVIDKAGAELAESFKQRERYKMLQDYMYSGNEALKKSDFEPHYGVREPESMEYIEEMRRQGESEEKIFATARFLHQAENDIDAGILAQRIEQLRANKEFEGFRQEFGGPYTIDDIIAMAELKGLDPQMEIQKFRAMGLIRDGTQTPAGPTQAPVPMP